MWMFTKYGFVSTVNHRDNSDLMILRFRCQEDARRFQELAKEALGGRPRRPRLTVLHKSDYRYRFYLPRAVWERLAALLATSVDYPNFKDAVHDEGLSRDDRELERTRLSAYHHVWAALLHIQDVDVVPALFRPTEGEF